MIIKVIHCTTEKLIFDLPNVILKSKCKSVLHSHHGWEGIGFMWKMTFEIFIKSLRFETPWVRKNGFYESVCLSVCL